MKSVYYGLQSMKMDRMQFFLQKNGYSYLVFHTILYENGPLCKNPGVKTPWGVPDPGLFINSLKLFGFCAGIVEQSMGAGNRVGRTPARQSPNY